MSSPIDRLKTERDEITARIAAASEAEKAVLKAQFDERLSHITARLEEGAEEQAPPGPAEATPAEAAPADKKPKK